jgi:hypothetical protein
VQLQKHRHEIRPRLGQDLQLIDDDEVGFKECNVHGHDKINGIREYIRIGIEKTNTT